MHLRRALSALLVVLVLPTAAYSQSSSELADVEKDLARARDKVAEATRKEKALKSQKKSTSNELQDAVAELQIINAELELEQAKVNAAQAELDAIDAEMQQATERLDRTLRELEAEERQLKARALVTYKQGTAGLIEYIFGTADLSEMFQRVGLMGRVMKSDRDRIQVVDKLRREVERDRARIAELREQSASAVEVARSGRDKVARLHSQIKSRSNALKSQLSRLGAELEDVTQTKEEWQKHERALAAESARIRSLLQGRTGGTAMASKGAMAWPVRGTVTSEYGWRTHPIYGTRKFHSGMDIAAGTGSSIGAAAPGTVIFAGSKGGYGNTVIVDHGAGVATLYAHMSSIGASEGTSVSTGQRLGGVGCTGACTGPHLHFEVRVNGDPDNPRSWLG